MTAPARPLLTDRLMLALALTLGLIACGEAPPGAAGSHSGAVPAPAAPEIELDVPFVPTPHEIVASMLEMGSVGADDHLIDLGSGDGRIVIAAVRDRGARSAEGIDLDPQRVTEAVANAAQAGVGERVHFEQGDLFDKDFSSATVLTLYLTQDINLRLRPRILDSLTPGSRVVSHVFHMGDWEPDREASMGSVSIYGWTVPARAGGRWSVSPRDEAGPALALEQSFQMLGGMIRVDDHDMAIEQGRLDGNRIVLHTANQRFAGVIDGDRMTLIDDDGRTWLTLREQDASSH